MGTVVLLGFFAALGIAAVSFFLALTDQTWRDFGRSL